MNWKSVLWVAAAVILAEAIAWGAFGRSSVSLWVLILVAALVSVIGGAVISYILRQRTSERTGQSTRP